MKLYVGNLPYSYDKEALKELFSKFASSIININWIEDKETQKFRGFAFVEFSSKEDAFEAINDLNGQEVEGKAIVVNEARPKNNDRPRNDRPSYRKRF